MHWPCLALSMLSRASQKTMTMQSHHRKSKSVNLSDTSYKTTTKLKHNHNTLEIMILAAFLATGLTAVTAEAVRGSRKLSQCSSVPTGRYCHLIDKQSHMALNIADGATYPGASAVQWEELADKHDNWRFEPSADGHYNLVAEHSNLFLAGKCNCKHRF